MVTTPADIEYFRVENRHGRLAAELHHVLTRIVADEKISGESHTAALEVLSKAQP